MRLLVVLFVALAGGIALTMLADNPGYVLLAREPWQLETTLGIFLLALLVLFGLFYALLRLLDRLLEAPSRLADWQQRRHQSQAFEDLRHGVAAAVSGDWQRAEKLLLRRVDTCPLGQLNYLVAAWSAQQRHDIETRDRYLAHASRSAENDKDLTTGIIQGLLQQQAGQSEQALAGAMHLHQLAPASPMVLRQLALLLEQGGDWQALLPLLDNAARHSALAADEVDALMRKSFGELLSRTVDEAALEATWKQVPKRLQHSPEIVAQYAARLSQLGNADRAEAELRRAINQHWSNQLVDLYGQLQTSNPAAQLKHAEGWASEHPVDSALMLTLGRLAARNQLWGMARSYLEVAVNNADQPLAHRELAHLLDSLDEPVAAAEIYRQGLECALRDKPVMLPELASGDRENEPASTDGESTAALQRPSVA